MKALTAISLSSLFFFFLVLPMVSAATPFARYSDITQGLIISYPNSYYIPQNAPLYVRFWVYNASNGYLMTNATVNCTYNLMDATGKNILRAATDTIPIGIKWGNLGANACANCFNINITSDNFANIGSHPYQIRCYDNITIGGTYGGFFSDVYEVTPSGFEGSANYSFVIIIISFVILLIGIFSRNIPTTILGGMAVTLVGLYSLINGIDVYRNTTTEWVSIILMSFGGFWMVKAGLEYLDIW